MTLFFLPIAILDTSNQFSQLSSLFATLLQSFPSLKDPSLQQKFLACYCNTVLQSNEQQLNTYKQLNTQYSFVSLLSKLLYQNKSDLQYQENCLVLFYFLVAQDEDMITLIQNHVLYSILMTLNEQSSFSLQYIQNSITVLQRLSYYDEFISYIKKHSKLLTILFALSEKYSSQLNSTHSYENYFTILSNIIADSILFLSLFIPS